MSFPLRMCALSVALNLMTASSLAADRCPKEVAEDPFANKTLPDLVVEAPPSATGASANEGLTADRPLRHVWVLDHSGSMYANYVAGQGRNGRPYYIEDPEFRRFVVDDVGVNFRDGKDTAAIIGFNEFAYGWDGKSARQIAKGGTAAFDDFKVGSRAELAERFATLPPPPYGVPAAGLPAPRPGANDCSRPGAASNCSKMLEGIQAARSLLDGGDGEGIIWLVTDNIYEGGQGSAGLTQAEVDQNRLFYEALKNTREFKVIVAYPVVQGTAGAWLGSTSLFVYGIYYDGKAGRSTGGEEVRRLIGDGVSGVLASEAQTKIMEAYSSPSSPSKGRPFRLKPLDQDVVRLSLAADVEQVKKHLEMGQKVKLKAKILVENKLDHRVIDEVTFRVKNAKWVGYEPNAKATSGTPMPSIDSVCADQFLSEPVVVKNIGPGQSVEVEVPLVMPPVDYTIGSAGDLAQVALNDYVVMGGVLRAELTDVKSRMFIDPAAFKGTYGAESLPQVFENPQVGSYTAQFLGKTRKIENPGTMMALLALAGAAASALGLAAGAYLLRTVNRRLFIDGADKGAVSMARWRSTEIRRGAETVGRAHLTMGGSLQLRGKGGYAVADRQGDAWTLKKDKGGSVRVELRGGRRK